MPGQRDELIEPAVGDDRVIVEQDEVFPARGLQALIDRAGEPQVPRIGDDRDRHGGGIADPGQVGGRVVGRAVVDDDQLPVGPGVAEERPQAQLGESPLIPAGDDDGRQAGRSVWIHGEHSLEPSFRATDHATLRREGSNSSTQCKDRETKESLDAGRPDERSSRKGAKLAKKTPRRIAPVRNRFRAPFGIGRK